jgi:SAM-dependent methyltransferase
MSGAGIETEEVKELVRSRYGALAAGTESDCCGTAGSSCCAPASAPSLALKSGQMGYSAEELAAVPEGANLGLGCGNPQAIAAMKPGEVIVDLGSGAGFDCFLASRQVGENGRVIGVDMTHEMLRKARENALKVGASNVEFRLGEIEHLPISDNTADVVISNCVVNLVPDKAQVFRDAFRVLKVSGRLAISDVVSIEPMPAELLTNKDLLCACISGAATVTQIEAWLAEAGFADIRVTVKPESRDLIQTWVPGSALENYVASAIIEARKPDPSAEVTCCAAGCCG